MTLTGKVNITRERKSTARVERNINKKRGQNRGVTERVKEGEDKHRISKQRKRERDKRTRYYERGTEAATEKEKNQRIEQK